MVAVILESHSIVYVCLYVGMFVWLMVTLASSSAVCRTINPTEKIDRAKKGRHRHTHTNTHTHTHTHSPVSENLTMLQEITTKQRSFKCPMLAHTHSVTDILSSIHLFGHDRVFFIVSPFIVITVLSL